MRAGFISFCGVFTDVYCYCFVSVLPYWKGFGGPELGWVIVCLSLLVGYWQGLGGCAFFYG